MTSCWELELATEGEFTSQKSVSTSCGLFHSVMFGEPVVKHLLLHLWWMRGRWKGVGRGWVSGSLPGSADMLAVHGAGRGGGAAQQVQLSRTAADGSCGLGQGV